MKNTIKYMTAIALVFVSLAFGAATAYAAEPMPEGETGELLITTRAEQSGNPLGGTAFGVYRVSDGVLMDEAATDADGTAAFSLEPGEYYLRNYAVIYGFLPERARIFITVEENGMVFVEVTIQRDGNITDADNGTIVVPQTGEMLPVMNYALGTALILIAVLCGFAIAKQRKQNHKTRKGALGYA